jgi:branched-chain amino acid transport system substrate-binding protein
VSKARKVIAVAVLAALAWAVALVTEAQPPIRIGASLSLTGVYAAIGPHQLRGYQLCVKHMNEKGGVLGRKLELVHYDNGSDPPRPSVSMWCSVRTPGLSPTPWQT